VDCISLAGCVHFIDTRHLVVLHCFVEFRQLLFSEAAVCGRRSACCAVHAERLRCVCGGVASGCLRRHRRLQVVLCLQLCLRWSLIKLMSFRCKILSLSLTVSSSIRLRELKQVQAVLDAAEHQPKVDKDSCVRVVFVD
jgi:hypothetical protein